MAPRTRNADAKRRLNHVSRDVDGMDEHEQLQNEQEPDIEVSQQPIQKQVMTPCGSTQRETASSVFQDKQQIMQNRQPQIFSQASRGQEATPRTRTATGNQSVFHRLEAMDQVEQDVQYQNEVLEFQTTLLTNTCQVTAATSQRSTVNRRPDHDFLDEDEIEVCERQDDRQHANLEAAEALKNALHILTASSTRRAITNQISHIGYQDRHQREENAHWKNRRQIQPSISQQVSMMDPTSQKASTRNHLGHHRLRDGIQTERDGLYENEEQPNFEMNQQVKSPITQRSTAKRKLNHLLLDDDDEIAEHGQQGNVQSNLEITEEIENALKILMAPSTRRAIANLNSNSGFQDRNQVKENGHPQRRKQSQPQISHQASMMASRTRKATAVQSVYQRLLDKDQLEQERQHQNIEQPEFQTVRETKDKQVMTHSTRRSTAQINQGEDEIEEHRHQENEQVSDVEVSQAIENALKILMTSTRRPSTNENSHGKFQDRHQTKESMQQQSRQHQQPQVSQQASISAVMPPTIQNVTGNQSGYHGLRDEDEMLEVEEELNGEQPEVEMANNKKGAIKKVRGPTLLREIWGRNPDEEHIKVTFNKRGQPVGPNKKKFTGFLGTLARNGKYSPLDIDDWRKVPQENKDAMIKLVKERFEIPEGTENWILLSIGRKRNGWRSRVKTQCFDPTVPIENQTHKIPPRVNEEQWKNLLTYWANEDVMKECERNKISRQHVVMHQTTGKTSFAEIEEELRERLDRSPTRVEMFSACFTRRDGSPSTHEVGVALARMKEYQSKFPEDLQDPVRPDDSFAKVSGNDPLGKIRMVGLGANQSDLWGVIPSRATCYRMALENQAVITRVEEKLDHFTKLVGSLQEKVQLEKNPSNVRTTRQPVSPGQSCNSNYVGHQLQVGDSVVLKSLFDQKKIVAKGCLESVDPDQYVGGRRLGSNWYGVQISVPIEWDEDLIRPYSSFSTIGESVGNCVAWPHHLVSNEDNQE